MADKQEFLNYYNLLDQKLKKMVNADNSRGMVAVFAKTIRVDIIRETLLSIVRFRNDVLAHGVLPVGFNEVDDSYVVFLKKELAFVNSHYEQVKRAMLAQLGGGNQAPAGNNKKPAWQKGNEDPDIVHFREYRKDYCDYGEEPVYCIEDIDHSELLSVWAEESHSARLVLRPCDYPIVFTIGNAVTRNGKRIRPLYIDSNLTPFEKGKIRIKSSQTSPIADVELPSGEQTAIRKLTMDKVPLGGICYLEFEIDLVDEKYNVKERFEHKYGFVN